MSHLIDISPRITERIAVWPGDEAFRRKISMDMQQGDHLSLSSFTSTVHVGAHADAPSHYKRGGASIADRPLELYFGPCQVVEAAAPRGARLERRHLQGPIQAARVLFKTGSFPDPERWNDDFNSLSPDLVDQLHSIGVRLVGIDTPSVDPFADKVLESHQRVAAHDMAILEGLRLGTVRAGFYILVALPLALEGADGSPVRAALLKHGDPSLPLRPDPEE